MLPKSGSFDTFSVATRWTGTCVTVGSDSCSTLVKIGTLNADAEFSADGDGSSRGGR